MNFPLIFFASLALASIVFVYFDKFAIIHVALFGRRRLFGRLRRFAKHSDFLFIRNFRLLKADGEIAVIDFLLLGDRQIYLIKNKQWIGDLTGVHLDSRWRLFQGAKEIHVVNPIRENEEAIEVVSQLISATREDFINIVVFPDTVNVDDIRLESRQMIVNQKRICKAIRRIEANRQLTRFTEEALERAASRLREYHLGVTNKWRG